jgi:hypothetical protein
MFNEPPYAERHVRWCERTVREIIPYFLLDLGEFSGWYINWPDYPPGGGEQEVPGSSLVRPTEMEI